MLERPAAVRAAGFDAIEVWWPFPDDPDPGPGRTAEFVKAVQRAGVAVVSLNFDTGDARAGERGLMCRQERLERLRRNVPVTIEIAKRLRCRRLNALYGNVDPDRPRSQYHDAALESYRYACQAAASIGAQVMIEPINTPDAPRYGVRSIRDALELRRELSLPDLPSIGILIDVYRLGQDQRAIDDSIVEAGRAMSHIQIADTPGRNEPGTGSIDFRRIIQRLRETNYEGYIGLEYTPSTTTLASLETCVRLLTG